MTHRVFMPFAVLISGISFISKRISGFAGVKLEQNYRSTKVIVNAANSVIKRNTAQLKRRYGQPMTKEI
jgi:superfamily I DNA/RNA helicase